MPKALDLIGQRYGRLVVTGRDVIKKRVYWDCRCDCGKDTKVFGGSLRAGRTKSCGCLTVETTAARNLTHGSSARGAITREYRVWCAMRSRCNNPNDGNYERYGGRGIAVCERWSSFEAFVADMGPRPPSTSLDRINNNGNYEPGNCHWATKTDQARNRRSNRLLTHDGQTMTIAEWAQATGIRRHTIAKRIDHLGWSVARALTTPVRWSSRPP